MSKSISKYVEDNLNEMDTATTLKQKFNKVLQAREEIIMNLKMVDEVIEEIMEEMKEVGIKP